MMSYDELLGNFVEIEIDNYANFRIIKETLSRMGIGDNKKKRLYRSCHILEIDERFFIVHFKELFLLDKKDAYIIEGDIERRNEIAKILESWNLCRIVNREVLDYVSYMPLNKELKVKIFILAHKQKHEWELVTMYTPKEDRVWHD